MGSIRSNSESNLQYQIINDENNFGRESFNNNNNISNINSHHSSKPVSNSLFNTLFGSEKSSSSSSPRLFYNLSIISVLLAFYHQFQLILFEY
jgi:hypothetical protein